VLTTLDLHHTDLDHDHYNRAWQTHDLHHSVQQRNQSKGWRPFTCTQQPGTAARDLYFSTQSRPWSWRRSMCTTQFTTLANRPGKPTIFHSMDKQSGYCSQHRVQCISESI
jgi:hypothetical protein